MVMTKKEYLTITEKKAAKISQVQTEKWKRKRHIILCAFIMATIFSVAISIFVTASKRNQIYCDYISDNSIIPVTYENISYKDTFSVWNKKELGNDVNTLFGGGKIYNRDGIVVFPDDEGSGTSITINEDSPILLPESISYINYSNNIILYRNDTNRNVFSFNCVTKKEESILQGNIGEIFLSNSILYYIDYESNCALYSLNLDTNERSLIITGPLSAFAVCGDTIVYLNCNQNLRTFNIAEHSDMDLINNVERFFINGDIIAESKNTIFSFSPEGSGGKKLYESQNDSLRLVGADASGIYLQEDGKLDYIKASDKQELISDEYSLYGSINKDDTGHLMVVAYYDGLANNTAVKLIELIPDD